MKKFMTFICLSMGLTAFAGTSHYTISNADLSQVQDELQAKVVFKSRSHSVIVLSEKDVVKLSKLIHERLHKCGGFKRYNNLTSAIKFLTNGPVKSNSLKHLLNYEINQEEVITPMLAEVSEEEILKTIIKLSSFQTRYMHSSIGAEATLSIRDMWKDMTKHRSDVKVETVLHRNEWTNEVDFPQQSVILTIEGSEKPDEIVIIGGHADSISMDHGEDDKRSPGADDNASGIAAVTEVMRVLVQNNYKPKKTIQFMAYAGEELGLRGSDDIARKYRKANKNVVGVLQLDMILYQGTKDQDIVLMTDYTNKTQNEFMAALIDKYVQVPWGYDVCGGCSDHQSWHDQGYAASFPFESRMEHYNQFIHSADDTIEKAGGNGLHAVKFTKLGLSYVVEMAD